MYFRHYSPPGGLFLHCDLMYDPSNVIIWPKEQLLAAWNFFGGIFKPYLLIFIFLHFRVFNPLVVISCTMTPSITPLNSLFVLGSNFYFLNNLIWWTPCKFICHVVLAVKVHKYRNPQIHKYK